MHSWKRSEKKNFCACFYSLSEEEGNQTEPEAFYIEEEKERDDGLLTLFLTPQKKPPFL